MNPLFARTDGSVLDLPSLRAGADDGVIGRAERRDFIPLPGGSLLLTLPGRSVVGFEGTTRSVVDQIDGTEVNAVAAALPLGYTRTLLPAYVERTGAPPLPLYG